MIAISKKAISLEWKQLLQSLQILELVNLFCFKAISRSVEVQVAYQNCRTTFLTVVPPIPFYHQTGFYGINFIFFPDQKTTEGNQIRFKLKFFTFLAFFYQITISASNLRCKEHPSSMHVYSLSDKVLPHFSIYSIVQMFTYANNFAGSQSTSTTTYLYALTFIIAKCMQIYLHEYKHLSHR
ncbi:hypothetical protein EGR_07756 [Echinococcus granulosus]|uniref:Uncharacterized protein n=1 Tax=Echinococcus granulosus TaxID=6210 RepID=W6U806_ECHGR|nr:hypothetical protein EGR_07756 [Echinococcus granulosus]EUB57363.1 hypothetical protein EGR_07756 [Echinococcus granulosus]